MSGRDSEPKKPASGRPGFLGRTKAMSSGGSSGWEATTIGFTLVGCIGATSALGYWLDSHFKTNYWLPILFLVGVIAGFREMFVVLGRISREQELKKRQEQEKVRLAPNPTPVETIIEPAVRERIFQVPPPPVPGQAPVESRNSEPESVEELIERLMGEEKDNRAEKDDQTDESK